MSGWSNPDVTPARSGPGVAAGPAGPFGAGGTPPSPPSPDAHAGRSVDPFGSGPTRRKRGIVRIVVGLVLSLASVGATGAGILRAAEASGSIREDAVAEGSVSAGFSEPFAFEVPEGGGDYTLWILFPGTISREPQQELTIRDAVCEVDRADGTQAVIRGSRQGVATSLGQASTIGWFSAPEGRVEVQCAYTAGTRQSVNQRLEQVPVVASPGRQSVFGDGIIFIVVGIMGLLLGIAILVWGLRGKRVPVA